MGFLVVSLTAYKGEKGVGSTIRNEFLMVCTLKETYSVEENCSKNVLNIALIENMFQTTILKRIARVETFHVATSVEKNPFISSLQLRTELLATYMHGFVF